MLLPNWVTRGIVSGCDHDFSVEREIPDGDVPPFVRGPVVERFCSACGQKETLADRIARAVTPQDAPYRPPAQQARASARYPDPQPLESIHVELQLERRGRRYDNDRRRGIVDRAVNVGPDPRWNDAMAAAAEEYVGRALGLRFNDDVDGPDKGWDMAMFGRRVQVKWTKIGDGSLIASPSSTMNADYYVLVVGGSVADFRIAGWATAKELKASTKDLGYGATYVVAQSDLRPFADLLAIRLAQG